MNWYEHHIGDWMRKCSHLSLAEEGCYRRLLDWYYAHEAPLPVDIRAAARCARCVTPADRKTLKVVLEEFFVLTPDGWRNERCDREIVRFASGRCKGPSAREAAAERSRVAREYRRQLFALLRERGVVPGYKTRNEQLVHMLEEMGVTAPRHGTQRDERDGTERHSVTAPISQYPSPWLPTPPSGAPVAQGPRAQGAVTPQVGADDPPHRPNPSPTRAGAVCRAMRAVGLQGVNPSHPELLRLLAEGATEEELAFAAAEAAARGKGFPYALGIVASRRNEAAPKPADGPPRPQNGPRSADQDRVATWAPTLGNKTL